MLFGKKCPLCGHRFKPESKKQQICQSCIYKRNKAFELEQARKKEAQIREEAERRARYIAESTINGRIVHTGNFPGKDHDYSDLFYVVGVTFKNGRRHRQTILRQIRFRDPPYTKTPTFTLRRYFFQGEYAVAVFANDEQVGNISRRDLPWLLGQWKDYYTVSDYDVYGGGKDRSYGLVIRVCFKKDCYLHGSNADDEIEELIKAYKQTEAEKIQAAADKAAALAAKEAEKVRRQQERQKRAEEKEHRSPSVMSIARRICQYDDDMNLIKEHESVSSAAKAVGISPKCIRDAATGRQKHAAGFVWRYSDPITQQEDSS